MDRQGDPRRETEDAGGDVGSVADEATKLLGAFAEWARDHGSDHVGTDDSECRYCPLCRTAQAVRSASPEVRDQLTAAASSFLSAAAGMLAASSPEGPNRSSSVERIDLDDDRSATTDGEASS